VIVFLFHRFARTFIYLTLPTVLSRALLPISARGYDYTPLVILKKEADQQYLEPDEHGNMVPKSPGR